MVRKYGNIYFYKPHPHQLPVHSDPARAINIHGQNSGGKSYNAAAWISEEVVGYSPYREVRKPPFGVKRIWIVTTTYQIQENSSQSLLFSENNAVLKDIGLLPSLETIQAQGGYVVWEKGERAGILKKVVMPDQQVEIEFKSMESRQFSMAGAAVDIVWVDEVCPEGIYNELVTRVLRKDGRLVMSYLVGGAKVNNKIPGEWVVTDLYPDYEKEVEQDGSSSKSFYFFEIEQNLSLDTESVKEIKSLTTSSERAWRFAPGGKFNLDVDGTKVWGFTPTIHIRENILETFDDFNVLFRAWDLGYNHPSCTAFQIDKYNRVRIMFNVVGKQILLQDFIPVVKRRTSELLPDARVTHELLPHDANRKYDTAEKTARQIFVENGLASLEVIYIHAEESIKNFNSYLQRLIKNEPAVLIDAHHAGRVVNALQLHTRHEKTGEPLKDGHHEHPSDNCKMIAQYLEREGLMTDGQLAKYELNPGSSFYLDTREPVYGE